MLVIRLCLYSEPISLYPEWARTPSVRTDTDTDLRAQPPPRLFLCTNYSASENADGARDCFFASLLPVNMFCRFLKKLSI